VLSSSVAAGAEILALDGLLQDAFAALAVQKAADPLL
jgi:hypothetical protein